METQKQSQLRSFVIVSVIINLVLFILVAVSMVFLLNLKSRLNKLENQQSSVKQNNRQLLGRSDIKAVDGLVTIDHPQNNAMILTNRIDIDGEAGDNHIISLSINDRILGVTIPKRGKFNFTDIPVNRGANNLTVKAIAEDGTVLSLQTVHFKYSNPTVRYLARNVTRGDVFKPKIALTFDGGYMANAAQEILDTLHDKKIQTTLFLTGMFIDKYPEMVLRMVKEGHEIGNHTWSHSHLTDFAESFIHTTKDSVTRDFLHDELIRTSRAFENCTGTPMARYWRAPFGEHNNEIREWAGELGYQHVGWTNGKNWRNNLDTMDWVSDSTASFYHTSNEILKKILTFGKDSKFGANGAIIMMHLGTKRNHDFPHKKLPEIIDGLREQGYELVRISELLDF